MTSQISNTPDVLPRPILWMVAAIVMTVAMSGCGGGGGGGKTTIPGTTSSGSGGSSSGSTSGGSGSGVSSPSGSGSGSSSPVGTASVSIGSNASGGVINTSGGIGTPQAPVVASPSDGIATLVLNISGTTPGVNADVLQVAGNAKLNGLLILNFTDGFTPATGQKFTVVEATGGISGGFTQIITNGVNLTSSSDSGVYAVTVD